MVGFHKNHIRLKTRTSSNRTREKGVEKERGVSRIIKSRRGLGACLHRDEREKGTQFNYVLCIPCRDGIFDLLDGRGSFARHPLTHYFSISRPVAESPKLSNSDNAMSDGGEWKAGKKKMGPNATCKFKSAGRCFTLDFEEIENKNGDRR